MLKSERRCLDMVEKDVRYAGKIAMARDRNDRHLGLRGERSIDHDQAFCRPLLQKERIFFNELVSMAMTNDKIEVAFLQQVILDPRHNQRGIPFADFRDDYTNGITALLPERLGEMIGPVIQLPSGLTD